ncbi:Helix-turn-helix domain protein [Planctomycetes bacterium CA13]|uniref:Helix-turn-helix domain protein n=1 Tax=Novipirellula herctigrandis TaxID=2527986 RepID=A0A5C5Z1L7_9BACT|nr:Helix-turn-helix domain protein [Planctomycetes bacterium CA13]
MTTFGERIRKLRQAKGWTLRQLAPEVGVGFTYLSKVENERLDTGHYPSEALIHRLADALGADEDELLLLANKVPEAIRRRICEHPDIFRTIAQLDDTSLQQIVASASKHDNVVF